MFCTNFDICTLNDTLISLVASFMDCSQSSPEYGPSQWTECRIGFLDDLYRGGTETKDSRKPLYLLRDNIERPIDIDICDWRNHTVYTGEFFESHPTVIVWFLSFFIGRPSGTLSVNSLMKINSDCFDSQQVTPLPLYDSDPRPITSSVVGWTIWRVQKDDTFPFVLVRSSPILWIKTR